MQRESHGRVLPGAGVLGQGLDGVQPVARGHLRVVGVGDAFEHAALRRAEHHARSMTEMTLLPKCAYCSLIQIIHVTIRRR